MLLFDSLVEVNSEIYESLVIFSGQLEGDSEEYGFLFEELMRSKNPRPRIVLFIYPGYLTDTINEISEVGSSFYDNIIRYGDDIPIMFCSFNEYAELSIDKEIFCDGISLKIDGIAKNIINDGILSLAKKRKNAVILQSPPGTVFVKPSKKQLGEFIQASGLTVGYAENQFVAFSLLHHRPRNIDLKMIYIDTAGISTFVEALIYYIYRFSHTAAICTEVKYLSFNSYFGVDKQPDDKNNAWVIISASNSNSMGNKIVNEWGITKEQVLTVLSYSEPTNNGKGDTIVCNISSISDGYKNPDSFVPPIGIKVTGENFTVEVSEPNQVLIKINHKTQAVNECIEPYSSGATFSCLRTSSNSNTVRPVYIDVSKILKENEEFNEWLNNVVSWYMPATLKWIVYNKKNNASKELYNIINKNLSSCISPTVISYEEAETKIKGDGAVLILEPAISNGRSLLRLNRNLRISGHKGNRIFICPFVTASSELTFKNLKKSLVLGPNGLKYQFFNFHEMFIGHSDSKLSWQRERDVVEGLQSEFWSERAKVLSMEGEGINGLIGTPSLDKDEKLEFTIDFAFWNKGYDCNKINHEAVYATIASILQKLREKKYSEGDKDSLYAHVYQHSVIDPDNFTRFNDGLIQSCLWRAANASEVDYKGSDHLSESFAVILRRLINDLHDNKPNSALDLLIGIAIGKITLTKNVLQELITYGKAKLKNKEYVIELLDYIEVEFLK